MSFTKITSAFFLAVLLVSCAPAAEPAVVFPTYDPFVSANGFTVTPPPTAFPSETAINAQSEEQAVEPITTRPPTPTRVPLNISPLIGAQNQIISSSPTPDLARILPTPRQATDDYTVQTGDTLASIAERYNISLQALMDANNITDPNTIVVEMDLVIPAPEVAQVSSSTLKIIPNSELVNGPAAIHFDVRKFIASQHGYLAHYNEDVKGILLNGASIIEGVATNYSVNPRLLLAVLEYQSGWVTNPNAAFTDYPMGYVDANRVGLYRQTVWAANMLNRGYYLWKANAISTLTLADGQVIPIDPTINAGTVAIQYLFAQLYGYDQWLYATSQTGVVVTYFVFFGNPFSYAIEPLTPAGLAQPAMSLPFAAGERWYFTGGPHGAWDFGSAWGALDFAPPDNPGGCGASTKWVLAMADGLITRTGTGSVFQDLDNDGYEQTGWVAVYMHVAAAGRIAAGNYLFRNERVGHPSCEGGFSNATHLHVTRKYNGEWIPADGPIPFNLDGWISSGGGNGIEYDGYLTRGSTTIEAINGAQDANLISR